MTASMEYGESSTVGERPTAEGGGETAAAAGGTETAEGLALRGGTAATTADMRWRYRLRLRWREQTPWLE